jgi:hypothetical protein
MVKRLTKIKFNPNSSQLQTKQSGLLHNLRPKKQSSIFTLILICFQVGTSRLKNTKTLNFKEAWWSEIDGKLIEKPTEFKMVVASA